MLYACCGIMARCIEDDVGCAAQDADAAREEGAFRGKNQDCAAFCRCRTAGGTTVTVAGWVRSVRDMKNFGFVTVNDGSCFKDLQVVMSRDTLANYDEIAHQVAGAAVICMGEVKLTPAWRRSPSS